MLRQWRCCVIGVILLFFPLVITTLGAVPAASSGAAPSCDTSLWNHVYKPARLQIINPCIKVMGKIAKRKVELDGDVHIQLKLDPPYQNLLNQRNRIAQNGNLVLEPICVGKVTQPNAKSACSNLANKVQIPAIGTHVSATGSYVQDNEPMHGWREIHPVTSITPLDAAIVGPVLPSQAPAQPPINPADLTIRIASLSSPLSPGTDARLEIQTMPGAECDITVVYKSGPSQASGLVPTTADAGGRIVWMWHVGTRTTPGTWPILIECVFGQQTAEAETEFTVR
jgi:hypothetical protein